jgi:hypothetical protein
VIRSSYGSTLRRLMIGGVALLVPVLAGCEAGNGAPVLQFHPAANGAQGTTDSVTISDAFILGGTASQPLQAGGSASMFLSVYNGGDSADKLVGIDATGSAKSVQLSGGSIPVPAQNTANLEGPRPKVVLRAARADAERDQERQSRGHQPGNRYGHAGHLRVGNRQPHADLQRPVAGSGGGRYAAAESNL